MIVDALPQPLLLTAVAPPELLLAPELELPLAPESPVEADPPLEPESIEIPELDVEPPPEAPELDPLPPLALPELDALPEEEIAPSLPGELSLVEWLPHALVIAARHARHPVNAEWRRAHPVTLSTLIGSLTAAKFLEDSSLVLSPEVVASGDRSGLSCSGFRLPDPSRRERQDPANLTP